MSKHDEITSCFHCRHSGWTLERKLFCAKLQKEVGPIDDNYLSADCPLRDWPNVSMEQVNALIYELATKTIYVEWGKDIYGKDTARADLRIRPAQEIIAKFCDSISVEKEK